MKTVLILHVIFSLAAVLATGALADQRLNVSVPGGGAQDMLNMTTIPPEVSDSSGDHTLQRSCTNPSGRVIRQGQQGYDDCLKMARGKKSEVDTNVNSNNGIFVHSQSQ